MALPGNNNSISLSQIQTEFGGTDPISLTEYYRGGSYTTDNNTNVPTTGEISMTDFFGTLKRFSYTFTSSVQEADLNSIVTTAGWNGSDPIHITINSGVYLWSDDTSVGGLTISSAFNGLLTVTNNGYIIGRGGNGGNGGGSAGQNGGPAIKNSATGVILTNASGAFIAGGGGGGGGGWRGAGGGGAGGGTGGTGSGWGSGTSGAGGAGGAIGQVGSNGQRLQSGKAAEGKGGGAGGGGATGEDNGSRQGYMDGAGGGGRILGAGATGGDGGGWREADTGGDGGANGSAGANGRSQYGSEDGGGGGGGWGANGGNGAPYSNRGLGGAAISGTSISVTHNGTIYGSQA